MTTLATRAAGAHRTKADRPLAARERCFVEAYLTHSFPGRAHKEAG